MATTTNRYLSYPALAAGVSYSYLNIGTFWANGTWTTIVPSNTITSAFNIVGLTWQINAPASNNTLYEFLFDIGVSSVVAIQFPVNYGNVTNVGYVPNGIIMFPEPKSIAANSLINMRISSGASTLPTTSAGITGIKLIYQIA